MNIIDVVATKFNPNLRILKNYIIIYEINLIKLLDLNGKLLDNIIFENCKIVNIEILNDNFIVIAFYFSILIMKINYYGLLAFHDTIKLSIKEQISNILKIRNSNLFVISCKNKMKIYEINQSNKKLIQEINNGSISCLNFHHNMFISYNFEYISLYQSIMGTKIYQLSSKIKLFGNKCLTKLNGKILLVLLDNYKLYAINLKSMEIELINFPIKNKNQRSDLYDELFFLFEKGN